MSNVTDEALAGRVRESLVDIIDPCSAAHARPMGLVEMGLIKWISAQHGEVTVQMQLTSPSCMMVGWIASEIRAAALRVPGVSSVEVKFDQGLDWDPEMIDAAAVRRRHERLRLIGEPRRPAAA